MAFGGPTVGEQRATAQLNANLNTVGEGLGALVEALRAFNANLEAQNSVLQEISQQLQNK